MTDGSMRVWDGGVGGVVMGGRWWGQWPWTQQGFKEVTWEVCPVPLQQLFLSAVPHPHQGSSSLLQQLAWLGIRVESDGKDMGPPARGLELPPARLGRQWEAEPGSVYPGHALPEQMGACQCCQPGTGLTPSYCQVAVT